MLRNIALSQLQLNCLNRKLAPLSERYTQQYHAVNIVLKTCNMLFTFNSYNCMPLYEEECLIETSNKNLLSVKFIHMYKKCL